MSNHAQAGAGPDKLCLEERTFQELANAHCPRRPLQRQGTPRTVLKAIAS